MDVGDVMTILDRMEAELIGRTMGDPAAEAAAGHPDREPEWMMIAAVPALGTRGATELRRPDHQRLLKQSPPLEVLEQPGDRPVNRGALPGMVLAQAAVRGPRHRPTRWNHGRSARTGRHVGRTGGGRSGTSAPKGRVPS